MLHFQMRVRKNKLPNRTHYEQLPTHYITFKLISIHNLVKIYLISSLCVPLIFAQVPPIIGRPMFDCRRIHARYCCSSRVRYSCPELCGNNPCLNPFPIQRKKSYLKMFTIFTLFLKFQF